MEWAETPHELATNAPKWACWASTQSTHNEPSLATFSSEKEGKKKRLIVGKTRQMF